MGLIEMAKNRGETSFFQPEQGPDYGQCDKQVGAPRVCGYARRRWLLSLTLLLDSFIWCLC